ncbi:cytochrome P450 [Podospora conica]|nr:cytochrome P450 [Schizothecium conicum]
MHKWAALHARYGSVVRIAPDQLSYTTPAAWRDIYGVRGTSNKDAAAPSQMDKEELTFPGSSFEFFAPAKPMISLFPPGAINMPRTVPGEGAVIDGAYVPGGMTVGVAPYAAYRAERYWVDAGEFRPERWLEGGDGKGRYAGDMREVFKPFGYGPRNCVGQALAMVECRVVIARLFWRFEVEVLGGQDAWMGQKTFLSWEKPRLMVKVRSREARA